MSNPTKSQSIALTAANGQTFTGEIVNRYEYQGQTFVDIKWNAAHGYPETVLHGYEIENLS